MTGSQQHPSSVPASEKIARTSAEGLCQSIACELFPEFKAWFDAHPELRPAAAETNLLNRGSDGKLTTIPMHYKHPNSGGFTAELPIDVRKAHPKIKLRCTGEMLSDGGRITEIRIFEITFNGQARTPGSDNFWSC